MHTISQSLSERHGAMGEIEAPPVEPSLPMRCIRTLLRAWRARQTLQVLAELDDAILRDIGLTRADLRDGRKLPMAVDLAAAFEHRRAARGAGLFRRC